MPRNLLDITDLSVEELDKLIETAEDIIANPEKYQNACAHKQLATLFFELVKIQIQVKHIGETVYFTFKVILLTHFHKISICCCRKISSNHKIYFTIPQIIFVFW